MITIGKTKQPDPYVNILESIQKLTYLVEFDNADNATKSHIEEMCNWCVDHVGTKYVDWGYAESGKNWLFKSEDDAVQFSLMWN